jgi:hypothetical protein
MRCIQAGCLGMALGMTVAAQAQEPAWRTGPANPANQPAVTLGPPTVSLGAPRALTGRGDVAPCGFGIIARGVADDKNPMPPGPILPGAPTASPSTLTAPTPLAPAAPAPGMIFTGPATTGPVMSGPMIGDAAFSGPVSGGSCPTCAPDPSWAPLPGGVFAQESHPCGYIVYGSAEALFWWIRDSHLPPLLTVSPPTVAGAVAPGTRVLYGDNSVAPQDRIGGRFTVGAWLNECQNWGVVGSYFFLGDRGNSFAAAGDGVNVFSRPFLNTNGVVGGTPGQPVADREIIAFPGFANGTFAAKTEDTLWGADINARMNLLRGCSWRLDGLVGFRYLHFDEQITINETFQGTAGPNAGRMGSLTDQVSTANNFYGGQLGVLGEYHRGPWSLDVNGKVALGTTHQSVTATGAQMDVNEFGVPVSGAGLLVQPSNAGTRSRDMFSVVPEVTFNLGYQVTTHLKVFAGYDFLYWSNVARVGDQIDTTLDVNSRAFPISQAAGATRPAPLLQSTSFWAQGFNAGLQFTW